MKRFLKILAYGMGLVLLVIVIVITYISAALPNVGKPEDLHIVATPQRVAHGKYLATNVAACIHCHSAHDWSVFGGPADTAKLGIGGELFDQKMGIPGSFYASNITPGNLKSWTDGEIFRTITCGVKKDGSVIFPIMPWQSYSKLDREDLYDIIAYIRTLSAQEKTYPKAKLDFPVNIIVNTMPARATLGKRPSPKDTVQYGAYLVQMAACRDCHTKDNNGQLIAGMDFGGGREFKMPSIMLRSANITPDRDHGIGSWTRQQFVSRFKRYSAKDFQPAQVGKGEFQTIMPWTDYSGMDTTDLEAIFAYLKTVKPIANKVVIMDASVK